MSTPETILVADIGGTNARFALASAEPGRPALRSQSTLATARFASRVLDGAIVGHRRR